MIQWSEDSKLMLLTPEELSHLPKGTVITSIGFHTVEYDPDNPPDLDTRYGVTAWGLIDGKAGMVFR